MPSKSVPDPIPYVQWMLHSNDVSAQILKVFTIKSKWLCQAGAQAGDHGGRKGRALRNPMKWTGTASWWLPGVRDNALPSLVFSFPSPHMHGPPLPAAAVTWCNHSWRWTCPSLGLLLASVTVDLLWAGPICPHSRPTCTRVLCTAAAKGQDGDKGKDTFLCKTLEPFLPPPAHVKTTSMLPDPVISCWSPPWGAIDYAILLKTCSCLGVEKPASSALLLLHGPCCYWAQAGTAHCRTDKSVERWGARARNSSSIWTASRPRRWWASITRKPLAQVWMLVSYIGGVEEVK